MDLKSLIFLIMGVWCREEVTVVTWFAISKKKN